MQPNEINQSLIRSVTGFDPANPALLVSTNSVDPNVKAPRTHEVVVGFGKEMAGDFGINASYVWRRYDRFIWNDTNGITSADYSPVQFTPPASACPADARCEAVTYYVPNVTLPSAYTVTTRPDFRHTYNGLELVVRKRSSRGWMLTGSYSYNSTIEDYDSPAAYEDPTSITERNGFQYAPTGGGIGGGGGSNLGGIPINAKWIAKLNGSYRLPFDVNVAATADMRQGYPFLQAINIAVASEPGACGGRAARPGRRRALSELRDHGLPGRPGVHGRRRREAAGIVRHVQPVQREHGDGAARESECRKREPGVRDPGAADRARRRDADVLSR